MTSHAVYSRDLFRAYRQLVADDKSCHDVFNVNLPVTGFKLKVTLNR